MGEKNYVVCGMGFGDEGKGSFVDYLVHIENIQNIVRYNGGSQASHTVITPSGKVQKCSQLSSGVFLESSKIFLTENMVINIENLIEEARNFAKKTSNNVDKVLQRVFIHEDCYFVTPYHKLLNKLRELSLGSKRRGSVGTGVSEVMILLESEQLGVRISDVKNIHIFKPKLQKIHNYLQNFINENSQFIKQNMVQEVSDTLYKDLNNCTNEKSVDFLCSYYRNILNEYKLNVCKDFSQYLISSDKIMFEGAQGLLIDKSYGFKPNTTKLDTTNKFAVSMISKLNKKSIRNIGIIKAFSTRHGDGVFPTEDIELNGNISDSNQSETFWNGKVRFGWFDAVLVRYAQKINKVDEVFLSSIDKLDSFTKIKVCNSYKYCGTVDDEFKNIFEYEIVDDTVKIYNIRSNYKDISNYLEKCTPIYLELAGWSNITSKASKESELPLNCREYIKKIQEMINIKISLISVGPTRQDKIKIG